MLTNADFSILGPSGNPTTHVGLGPMGSSAADSWSVWHNTTGVSTTQLVDTSNLLPMTAPTGATTGILLTSTAANNGLFQTFGGNPSVASFDVWVWVLQGQVTIGLGNGGSTMGSVTSIGINHWEHLSTLNSTSPANEAIIYSVGPAVYYATSANVDLVPEPASLAVLGIGAITLLRRRRK